MSTREEQSADFDKIAVRPGQQVKLPKTYPLKRPDLEKHDRITIVSSISHEHMGDSPHQIQCTYWRMLDTQEQVYTRRVSIGEQPLPLDLGWFANDACSVGVVAIENLSGRGRQVNPTKEEREEDEKKILLLAYEGQTDGWEIYPGGHFIAQPTQGRRLQLRCLSGVCPCRVTIFPR